MLSMVLRMALFMAGLLGSVTSVVVTIPKKIVNVTAGMDLTLLCTYTTTAATTDQLTIQWSFHHFKQLQTIGVYYSAGGQSSNIGKYKNRVTGSSTPGNASITISNMQPSDSGVYICDVNNPPDFQGINQGFVLTYVLVKPSKPYCSIRGTPEADHVVSLSCHSAEGTPSPVYQWFKLEEDTIKPVKEQYNPNTGFLVISNLTNFEKGHYQCVSSNSLGNSSCEIDLTTGYSEAGIIAGALIGALLAAIIICLIVWFFTKKFKSKERKVITKEMQPMTKTLPSSEYESVPAQETSLREVPTSPSVPELLAPNHEEAEEEEK